MSNLTGCMHAKTSDVIKLAYSSGGRKLGTIKSILTRRLRSISSSSSTNSNYLHGIGNSHAMAFLTARWTKVATAEQLQRSSHTVSVVDQALYVFGGELKPREPRDNDTHKIVIASPGGQSASVNSKSGSDASPSPRVGAATAQLDGRIYLFSGRGGTAMAPIDEEGGLWSFDPTSESWSLLRPSAGDFPAARSYHAMTSDSNDKIYLHAGCPEAGRLSDLWSYTLSNNTWQKLAEAPSPPRGGTSIAYAQGKLYRMNGFDGKSEQGGHLDVYDPKAGSWSTITFQADGKSGPGARSVAALVPITIQEKVWLITLFGESDPSSLGHMGAGKMLSDVWAFSLEDATWSFVSTQSAEQPAGRGWFDADVISIDGKEAVAVVGGLGEANERLGDVWLLNL